MIAVGKRFGGSGGVRDDVPVVDQDTVVPDAQNGGARLHASVVDLGCGVDYVESLPGKWWQAHVDCRHHELVDSTTAADVRKSPVLPVLCCPAKRIDDLALPKFLQVDAAVSAVPATSGGHDWCAEFEVHPVILENSLAACSFGKQVVVDYPSVKPLVG